MTQSGSEVVQRTTSLLGWPVTREKSRGRKKGKPAEDAIHSSRASAQPRGLHVGIESGVKPDLLRIGHEKAPRVANGFSSPLRLEARGTHARSVWVFVPLRGHSLGPVHRSAE